MPFTGFDEIFENKNPLISRDNYFKKVRQRNQLPLIILEDETRKKTENVDLGLANYKRLIL